MPHLNYHHLRYFWVIASEGSMSRAAKRLNVSPSSLSVQLKALEDQLDQQLFDRRGKSLQLTEAGRIALDYANTVFQSGHELIEAMAGLRPGRQTLRVGAAATLSRNFLIGLLRPLVGREDVELVIRSGVLADLLDQLDAHKLDLVLANHPAAPDSETSFDNTLLAEQPVSLVGRPSKSRSRFRFPESLAETPVVLPGRGSSLRSAFDSLVGRAGIRPLIFAEVDDMAMLRLMARESPGVTLVPPVVVVDELRTGVLVERCRVKDLKEQFFSITQHRRFPNPLVSALLQRTGRSV
ncbi:LysR family transcriptional regulator [Bradyrhizobium diazoefficiens]|nr:LysR family transcriptional regulator [Bradyrhizobium diazoefficiens]UCF53327.1 MAG: LysR family transcriptional regulator [Bradyrhizobium sp.]MBR0964159.1 LysR family transcriptional regulator [Bradyrhizobium diazoefficiens]MBR0978319.1 LysR family transcriptional regulator [Bradyrhizobium diazoefficiens]MBR1006250.1 LysR family transcriptional regulator [Bradyrhizobium diazoefficiens]MBR1014302.1 LysR family transcriptional regulator [Bradyrhizobium diazoefficiens]